MAGFAIGEHHDAELAAAAIKMAVAVRGGDVTGVIFHTDRGSEYTAGDFAKVCERFGITQSMGRVGSALDNAASESFFSTLEFECLRKHHFADQGPGPPGSGQLDRRLLQPSASPQLLRGALTPRPRAPARRPSP